MISFLTGLDILIVVVVVAIRPVVGVVIVDIGIAEIVISIFIMEFIHFNLQGGKRFKFKTDNDLILDWS
jgi:hypothetical protein